MAEILARTATTHAFRQGNGRVRMTKESLESASERANGDRAIPFVVDHDPFCMPLGKVTEAWVEPYEDEHALVTRTYIEDEIRYLTHTVHGTQLVCLDFKDAPKPFRRKSEDTEENQITIGVDWANFDSRQEFLEFTNDVGKFDDEIICKTLGRLSIVPEPLIQFIVANPELSAALAVGAWMLRRVEKFVRYTVDETLRKAADDLSDSFSGKIRDIMTAYRNRQSEDDRPVLTEIIIPGDMDLILLTRTASGDEFPNIDLTSLTEAMEGHGELLQCAEEATFARAGNNDWEFQYLKTRSGRVMGTPECYERTVKKLETVKGVSMGISADDKDI